MHEASRCSIKRRRFANRSDRAYAASTASTALRHSGRPTVFCETGVSNRAGTAALAVRVDFGQLSRACDHDYAPTNMQADCHPDRVAPLRSELFSEWL